MKTPGGIVRYIGSSFIRLFGVRRLVLWLRGNFRTGSEFLGIAGDRMLQVRLRLLK